MYAFRKPFVAGIYEGEFGSTGIALKTSFVLAQIVGYTLSKYIGVKVCSEAAGGLRGVLLVAFVLWAELALVGFGLLPGMWKVVALFLNGLPLGMVWGLVVSFLEGRRCSDVLLACLCGSFIVASGAVKDVGLWLMRDYGISEIWMPAATGALFLPVFVLAVVALTRLPPPDDADRAARSARAPMDAAQRRTFLKRFAAGLVVLFAFYALLTAFRDFRDNYGVDIFKSLGYGSHETGLFTRSEIPVAVGSLLALAAINVIRDHRRALLVAFGVMFAGMLLLVVSTLLSRAGMLSGLAWMIATGLGAYLAYVPFNAILFERLMAATGSAGTAVFGVQLADSLGYTGSVAVQLYKDLGQSHLSRLGFFENFTLGLGLSGCLMLGFAAWYFYRKTRA
jgi:ABC-type multidrug transport system fused ATPase/permease subunit